MTSVQKGSGQSYIPKELDGLGEVDMAQKSRSTKEMDKLGEGNTKKPVGEDVFKENKHDRYEKEAKTNEVGDKK